MFIRLTRVRYAILVPTKFQTMHYEKKKKQQKLPYNIPHSNWSYFFFNINNLYNASGKKNSLAKAERHWLQRTVESSWACLLVDKNNWWIKTKRKILGKSTDVNCEHKIPERGIGNWGHRFMVKASHWARNYYSHMSVNKELEMNVQIHWVEQVDRSEW